jgi:hypothetical protein
MPEVLENRFFLLNVEDHNDFESLEISSIIPVGSAYTLNIGFHSHAKHERKSLLDFGIA